MRFTRRKYLLGPDELLGDTISEITGKIPSSPSSKKNHKQNETETQLLTKR
jgi:hypothetical protein